MALALLAVMEAERLAAQAAVGKHHPCLAEHMLAAGVVVVRRVALLEAAAAAKEVAIIVFSVALQTQEVAVAALEHIASAA